MLDYFQKVPFHNLFMLSKIEVEPSFLGGTCSDKSIHFKSILENNGFKVFLHSSFINNKETHRLLRVDLSCGEYYIDIGSGWPCIKAFPCNREIEYSCYGLIFKSSIDKKYLTILKKEQHGSFQILCKIPFLKKEQNKILNDIEKRFDDTSIYPFKNGIRYSVVQGDCFYFIKGSELRIYKNDSPCN